MSEQRYRETEARLHDVAGLRATEVWVDLPTIGSRARVLVTGKPEGDPVLFLTGGPDGGGSTWSFAAARLSGVRALLLDRPGTGLSPRPPDLPDATGLATYVADLTRDVLDALAIERATLVGCSFGGYSALRSAVSHPDRVAGVYLAGCPAFVPGWTPPGFFTALRTPVLGRLIPRLPASRPGARMSLKLLGHQRSLSEGRLPDSLVDWVTAWQGHTATMPNDAAMIRSCGSWLGGFDPSLDLDATDSGPGLGALPRAGRHRRRRGWHGRGTAVGVAPAVCDRRGVGRRGPPAVVRRPGTVRRQLRCLHELDSLRWASARVAAR